MKRIIKILTLSLLALFALNSSLFYFLSDKNSNESGLNKDRELGWNFSNYKSANYNDLGIRGERNYEDIKQVNKKLVVFLGNSVVAGNKYDYRKTFSHDLNLTALGESYLFLNAGQDGYEIYREIIKYKRDISKLKPEYVVWVPNTNDYQDWESIKRNFVETQEVHGVGNEKINIKDELTKGFNKLAAKLQAYKETNTEVKIWSSKNDFYTNPLKNELNNQIKKTFYSEISNFDEYLKKEGTSLIILLVPPRNFCLFNKWGEARSFIDLEKFVKGKNIITVNLFDKIKCKEKDLYIDYVHFNEAGHKEVSSLLTKEFKKILNNEKNI